LGGGGRGLGAGAPPPTPQSPIPNPQSPSKIFLTFFKTIYIIFLYIRIKKQN